MDTTFSKRLQNVKDRLTPVEKRISEYIIDNAGLVICMSVGELAKSAGVAPSGVIRYCRKLGYEGYVDLKISLASQSEPPSEMIMPAVRPEDDTKTIFEKVFSSSIKSLKDTLALMDYSVLERAADVMSKASKMEFYGVGTSATIAMDAYYRLMRIGYPAFCATDSQIMRVSAAQLMPGQLAVGISHSGRASDTIGALKIAREKGASTIAVTSRGNSPICREADLVLSIYSEEARYPIEAVSARIAHIAVLDVLTVALALRNHSRTAEKIRYMNTLFSGIRDADE